MSSLLIRALRCVYGTTGVGYLRPAARYCSVRLMAQRSFNPETDGPTTESRLQGLHAKSFGRTIRGYQPPSDYTSIIDDVVKDVAAEHPEWDRASVEDRDICFKLLTGCSERLQHDVPSALLASLHSVEHVKQYFSFPVSSCTAFEQLADCDSLPPNLHVQREYVRFDQSTDHFFSGQTAFPERETKVTSIKYSKKYRGHKPHTACKPKRERW